MEGLVEIINQQAPILPQVLGDLMLLNYQPENTKNQAGLGFLVIAIGVLSYAYQMSKGSVL